MDQPGEGWAPDTSMSTEKWATYPEAVRAYATDLATQILWAATGRRFGLKAVTVRPTVPRTLPAYMSFPASYDPGAMGGQWAWSLVSVPGGNDVVFGGGVGDLNGYWMTSYAQIPLPGPVESVTQVKVNGQALPTTAYRLDLGNQLVRQDGEAWPTGNDITAPDDQPNTWSVTYRMGEPVPDILNWAAGAYALEVAKARAGDNTRLPARATSVNRQGVNVQLVDITNYLDKGLTGVQEVDQVILSFNPNQLRSRSRVASLDMPTYR